MSSYTALWWETARHWTEIAAFSPLVMSERLIAMATTAGSPPTVAHQAEMTRMVAEKTEAVAESAAAFWLAAMHGQQVAWQRAWRAGRPAPAPVDYALGATTAQKYVQAWSPVSRRVTANAKRLAARKGRKR
jgi:hypothetical protein